MNLHSIKQSLKEKLATYYEPIELNSLIAILLEAVTGWDQIKQIVEKNTPLSTEQIEKIETITIQLINGKPIQYIIGKAWFHGHPFIVNEQVLIPRPETEELVEWVIEYAEIVEKNLSIIDIGTGSGCIAIALNKALPNTSISGLDISSAALDIAKKNAIILYANIDWVQEDILSTLSLKTKYDVMVSNPPYIPLREKEGMQIQVKLYEPEIALFVPNEDPLVYYRSIAKLGKQYLNKNGQLFFEIHYDQAVCIKTLLDEMGFHVEIRKDLFGNDRMVRASLRNT